MMLSPFAGAGAAGVALCLLFARPDLGPRPCAGACWAGLPTRIEAGAPRATLATFIAAANPCEMTTRRGGGVGAVSSSCSLDRSAGGPRRPPRPPLALGGPPSPRPEVTRLASLQSLSSPSPAAGSLPVGTSRTILRGASEPPRSSCKNHSCKNHSPPRPPPPRPPRRPPPRPPPCCWGASC
eukprot:1186591-Prorocentrum_minimum.AAC.2